MVALPEAPRRRDHDMRGRCRAVRVGDELAVDPHPPRGTVLLDPLKRQAGGGAAVDYADVGNDAARAVAGR
jgi:hypothetical protein